MKPRGAAIQGSLAALSLIAAYTTWQREPEKGASEAVVIDAGKSDVQKIRYQEDAKPPKWAELTSRKGDDGPEIWLRVSGKPEGKPPLPERELRGSEAASKLWEKFAPLRAVRALGTLDAAKMKEFGLDAPKKKIVVNAKGQTYTFLIGTSPYGVSDPYVKDERDGKVYVLGGSVLSDLDAAAFRLVDRTMHVFKPTEWDTIDVVVGSKKRELTQTGADNPQSAKLASKKSGKTDEMAKNWHDKLWRLFVTEALGKGENPAGGAPSVALHVEYTWRGKPKGFVEVGRVTPPAPESTSAPPPAPEIYARTEHTAGWVKVPPIAEDLLKEAEKVAAGD